MLVLTRKVGEWIQIGDVRVQVIHSTSGRVKIGVAADKSVKVLRGELVGKSRNDAA